MCRAFSCIVEPNANVIWKFGTDSHTDLLESSGLEDQTSDPSKLTFARVEITPNNGNYLKPDEWVLKVDQSIIPSWFGEKHRSAAYAARGKWQRKLDKILVRKKIVNPFTITPPAEITKKHINMLRKWGSVWDSVRGSVRDSVWDSVWDSVRGSVWDSVWDSVGAYIGSFFILPTWKYVKHPRGKYPFAPCVQLWNLGLVAGFDGKIWRLHGGPKAAVLFQIAIEELRK